MIWGNGLEMSPVAPGLSKGELFLLKNGTIDGSADNFS